MTIDYSINPNVFFNQICQTFFLSWFDIIILDETMKQDQ